MSKRAAIRRGRSVRANISGQKGRPWGIFLGFYKTRHIFLSDSANCTVLRAVVLTQYRRVTDGRTDGQTDGIAIGSTALAMRALRRAVKTSWLRFLWLTVHIKNYTKNEFITQYSDEAHKAGSPLRGAYKCNGVNSKSSTGHVRGLN